jgi:Fe-S-cluster containining protein
LRDGRAGAPEADGRLEIPLLDLPQSHPCHGCAACCRYVAVEIDAPWTPREYDQVHWYLAHRGVSVYVDWDGGWFIEFETVCENLGPHGACGVYRERPKLCSDFSWETCEPSTREPAYRFRFLQPEEFFEWLRRRRPRSWRRYCEHRRRLLRERDRAAASARRGRGSALVASHSSTSI